MNTFLYLSDKSVSKVSGLWKTLHLTIYIAVAVVAFTASMAAGNIFQTFNYNCILYCTNIEFESEAAVQDTVNNSTEATVINGTDLFEPVFQTELDGTLIKISAKIDVKKSAFAPNFWCNFVLGIALTTFIVATFFSVMLAMCSKGGRGQENTLNRPQNMIYPIIVSSVFLLICNLIAAVVVKNGTAAFCAEFEVFTKEKSCSWLMNHFTIHEGQENFYLPYLAISYTFHTLVLLLAAQITVTLLRVIYAVDYQLYILEVRQDPSEERIFQVEDGQIVKEQSL